MAKAANSDQLRKALETHRDETEGQVERLEQIFEIIKKPARAKTCEAMQGLMEKARTIMEDFKGTEALDARVSAQQAVEHDQSPAIGTLEELGLENSGMQDAAKLSTRDATGRRRPTTPRAASPRRW